VTIKKIDNLIFEENDSYLIIKIKDKLDSINAPIIHKVIEEKIKNIKNDAILDFEQLGYMTSAGLQVILMIAKHLKRFNKTLYIYKPQKAVDYVIQISGFYSFVAKIEKMP
jgi:anti-anti-sigma factor